MGGINSVQPTTGVPATLTIGGTTTERRHDKLKTFHHAALQRNVETVQPLQPAADLISVRVSAIKE